MDSEDVPMKEYKEKSNELPLIEKYRPADLSEMVSHEEIIKTLEKFVSQKSILHLIFYGPPGTGKTSCMLAMAKMLYPKNLSQMILELNASDDRGIEVVRQKIKEFCNTQVLGAKGIKLVILDEADFMTTAAQQALRRVVEKYTKTTRFCFICNQVSKIIPPIQSRCTKFRFKPLKRFQVEQRVFSICQKESFQLDEESIESMIEISKGDMRKILNIVETVMLSSKEITSDTIYQCLGLMNKSELSLLTQNLLLSSTDRAFKYLVSLKMQNGFSLTDIASSLLKKIRKAKLKASVKIHLLVLFGKIDTLLRMGSGEKVIME